MRSLSTEPRAPMDGFTVSLESPVGSKAGMRPVTDNKGSCMNRGLYLEAAFSC